MKYLVCALLFVSLNAHALLKAEGEFGLSNVKRDGQSKSSDGTVARLGASIGLLPLMDMDFKYGFMSGESDDKVGNLNGDIKNAVEHDTQFFAMGPSIKLLNWLRGGAGLVYQTSEHTLNSSTTSNEVKKDNDLGYYVDLGLYHMVSIWGFSLTYTHQQAGDVDSNYFTAGIVIGL